MTPPNAIAIFLVIAVIALVVSIVVRRETRDTSMPQEHVLGERVGPTSARAAKPTAIHAREVIAGSVVPFSDYDPYTERGIAIIDGRVATLVPGSETGLLRTIDVALHHVPEGSVEDVGILATGHASRAWVRTSSALYCYYAGTTADGVEEAPTEDTYRWHPMLKISRATHAATITETEAGRIILAYDESYVDVTDTKEPGDPQAMFRDMASHDERSNNVHLQLKSDGLVGYLAVSEGPGLSTGGRLYKWNEDGEFFDDVYTTEGTEDAWLSMAVMSDGTVAYLTDNETNETNAKHELQVRDVNGTIVSTLSRTFTHDARVSASRPHGEYLVVGRGHSAVIWRRVSDNGSYMDNEPMHMTLNGVDAAKMRATTFSEDGNVRHTILLSGEYLYELE